MFDAALLVLWFATEATPEAYDPRGQLAIAVGQPYCEDENLQFVTLPGSDGPGVNRKYFDTLNMVRTRGTTIAADADSPKSCKDILKDGEQLFEKELKRYQKSMRRNADYDKGDGRQIRDIQAEINRLWVADQAARQTYISFQGDHADPTLRWAQARATAHTVEIDYESTAVMKSVLEEFDWIDRHRFGNRIAQAAWLLVQHADHDPEFQMLALARMETYLDLDGVRKRDYAYLWDRVAVNQGRLQRYGTQPKWECVNGTMEPAPLEEPAYVDQRRAAMDMGPMADDLAQMAANVCR